MPETPDLHERVTKLQKDVEEIKEEMEDGWHERREIYENRISKTLEGDKNATILYLQIDDSRSISEIESALNMCGQRIPHISLWRAVKRLQKAWLIKKVGIKGKGSSPIYAKKHGQKHWIWRHMSEQKFSKKRNRIKDEDVIGI